MRGFERRPQVSIGWSNFVGAGGPMSTERQLDDKCLCVYSNTLQLFISFAMLVRVCETVEEY